MTRLLYPRTIRPTARRPQTRIRPFSLTALHQNEHTNNRSSSSSTSSNQDDPSLVAGISPWARFMDVLKSEYAKSLEMQHNVRELSGTAQGIKDSETAQKMRKAYTAMRLETLIRENPKLATMAKSLSSTGKSVTDVINKVANEIEESKLVQAAKRMSKELDKRIGEPIRNTEAYKVVEDTMDFSQGALRYGGYIEKEERKRRRQKRLARLTKTTHQTPPQSQSSSLDPQSQSSSLDPQSSSSVTPPTEGSSSTTSPKQEPDQIIESPNAPPALVLHSTANDHHQEDENSSRAKIGSGLKSMWKSVQERYEESENPMVSSLRTVTGFIKRNVFDETETAKVIRLIKEVDPSFNYDRFLVDLREFIVPDFVDSFVDNDLKSLKIWTSEAAYNVTTAPMIMYLQRGLRPANQIIDLKGIDIISAKVLEERNLPVFIVGFKTHEINCYINPNKTKKASKEKGAKTNAGERMEESKEEEEGVEVGSREEINQVQYVIILTKDAHLNASSSTPDPDSDSDTSDPLKSKSTLGRSAKSDPASHIKEAELDLNDITGGWKIIDLARRSTVAFL